ncbi:hypothetical protein CMI37_35825, partial [Candidatus Pacearchaeota archaeon]|nr:hypothetical protein [Candidatus Pacearchaeota archaeon]
MAESKFLKWQDQDGDGLIDECDDLIEAPELPLCLNCSPNPKALVPDWRGFRVTQPFLNEKLCEYQITKVTPHTTTVDSALLENEEENVVEIKAALEGRYDEFVDEAIDSLLEFTEKDDSDESKAKVKNDIKYYKYELPPRPNSRLKLLYSVPFDTIFDLPERAPEPEEEEEEEPGEMIVKYDAADLTTKMIRIRKALNLYARYLKVYRAMDGGNIFFSDDNRIFNLESYGDPALFTHSILSNLLTTLESFFNTKDYQMPGVGGITFFKDKIISVEFKTNNYKLKRIRIWTEGCGERPIWFHKKKLKALLAQPAWKDETAIAYLMQLFPMESAIMARVPDPWQEFIIKFTYPPVYSTLDQSSPEDLETVGSCIADALANEAKELGQDILDDVFGLGDAIAYLFHKNICRYDITETRADNIEMGLLPADEFGAGTTLEKYSGVGPLTGPDSVLGKGNKANMFGMAQMQAFKQLDAQDQVFAQLCGRILASMIGWGPAQSKMDQMWEYGFERIKQCGLFDLMMEAIACLLGGLSIDEMMAAMLKAALDSMGIENFGELFIGIPPEKQSELAAKVSEKLASGELGVTRQREEASLQAAGIGVDTPPRPWENQDIIDKERKNRGNSEAGKYGQSAQEQSQETRRTLAKQFDVAGSAEEELDTDIVMEAYILALMEVYSDNLMSLLDQLNKFPGAPIIAGVLAMMDCPRPPLFNPSILDFLKDIQLPWCRNKNEIRLPRLENPFAYLPRLKDLTWLLWQLIKEALMQLVMTIIIKLMVKICQIIGDAICRALEVVGDIAASMPEILQGSTTLKDVIKESICGPNASEQQVEDTIVEIMGTMGPGAAAFSNRDQVLQFAEDVSSSVTRRELTDAILGTPSREFTEIVSQLIEFEYPEYEKAMPTPDSIGNLFKNMGNLMPLDFRKQLQDLSESDPENELLPANPTLCATPEQLENFKNLRCELLAGRASKEQCDVMYDNLRSGFLEDLETLSGALQGTPGQPGIEGYIMDNMPPLVSAPGCDDGLIPFMSDAEAAVAAQAMGNDFEQLKIDYAKDMLGNGGLFQGDAGWGLINLVLSDTEGNPLTAHWRKAFNRKSYVHFATNLPNGGEAATGFFSALQPRAGFSSQHGQFPYYVGEWLMRQFLNAGEDYIDLEDYKPRGGTIGSDGTGRNLYNSIKFVSKNDSIGPKKYRISFEDLDFSTYMGGGVDLLRVPDFGYNVRLGVDYANQNIVITRRARKGGETASGLSTSSGADEATYTKGGSDISLDYKDNAAGKRYTCGRGMSGQAGVENRMQSEWSYGFEVQLFLSDIIEDGTEYIPVPDEFLPDELKGAGFQIFNAEDAGEYADAWEAAKAAAQAAGHDNAGTTIPVYKNRPDDNARIKIIEKVNMDATVESPFAELVQEELEKSDAFDLPGYIEKIPIVGWALQALVNIIMWPFSNLVRPESAPGIGLTSESIMRVREFEFLTIDDGLDDVDLAEFPALLDAFETRGEYIPQVVALAEMIGSTDLASVKTQHDDFMTQFFKKIAGEIGTNTIAWKHGASYDYLTKSDKDYLDSEGKPYQDQTVDGMPVSNDDMILGISRDQFDNEAKGTPENTRVFYLDPSKFGGNYMKPPIYIKPLAYEGWMGLVQVLFPEYTACKPHNVELVDFDEIQDKINERYPRIPEDPRLKSDPDCAVENPYNRIMSRSARASMGGLIEAAIRIYASTHFFKAIGTFSKIMPKFPENYSSLYSQYIVEVMEEGFKDAQADHWEFFSPFKDEEFWYAFLEQSVQYYGWLVDDGVIQDPPASVISAIKELNNMQEEYDFPWWEDWWEAVKLGDATIFQGLKGYRSDENLEAVQKSEELAKLVLKEL